ncbi:UDP-glucuronic acid decarboxylase family protein [Nonomuraea angiospora]|uniref:UDP-glucuronic acid decarboxylase family protein n=1 Tax=Nonomuraea angiospora TaxID=46172 RepID=UPI0029B9AE48|nr:UDP-glucuronic acid decarboxylase family protein [Nonomuraea angiospora]MDX3103362.1 SDR family oxidoreductase [Nonomuraea angiospora]
MQGGKRVLITGGSGFLGSHLCESLLRRGDEVICVDNMLTGSPANVEHLHSSESFTLIEADVTQPLPVDGPVDAVLHLACPASPQDYVKWPLETLNAGSAGTQIALDLAYETGATFLLASSSEVYGDPLVHPQPETYWGNVNPIGPRSSYDESKRFSEALTVAYRESRGVDCRIARIFNTFGPRMRQDDGRMVPTFISQAISQQPITVAGDGSQTRTLCYVTDTVEGIMRLLHRPERVLSPVNIGGRREMSILETAQIIRKFVDSSSPIKFVPRMQDDPQVRSPDLTLAGALLKWEPKVRLEDGIRKTIDWFSSSQACV